MKLSRPPDPALEADETIDPFLDGRLMLIQSRSGYRFSMDAIHLAEFALIRPGDRVVDLGTGCGIIPLLLLLTKPVGHVVGLEIQEELARQAARNVILNRFRDRMDVVLGDLRRAPLAEQCADVVICNPPYRQARSGRVNPDRRRAIARHEIMASVDDILQTSRRLLRKKGRLALIYPCNRLPDIMVRMRAINLEPKRIRINYPHPGSVATLALIEAYLGGRPGLHIDPPLFGQGESIPQESCPGGTLSCRSSLALISH